MGSVRVVGVGASAGGLEALGRFFEAIEPTVDAAFVVVQHLSPDYPSLMPQLLSRRTQLSVKLAESGTLLAAGCCYLMPPGACIRVDGDRLAIELSEGGSRHGNPIDTLLSSIAERGADAVAVVLSGTGSDGTQGAVAVREAGGQVMVQDPDSAEFSGMPSSVIDRQLATHVGTPDALARALRDDLHSADTTGEALERWMRDIIAPVRQHTGVDLSEYKTATLSRRLRQHLLQTRTEDPWKLVEQVATSAAEASSLLDTVLIDVTSFFRDPDVFDAIATEVLPQIVASLSPTAEVRVWCAGCARGHEAYSLAMLLEERRTDLLGGREFRVFATDVSRRAIRVASRGEYPADQVEALSPERVARFFERAGDDYRIHEDLRSRLVFAAHNLQRDPPFTQVDLVSCRNVLIYFRPALQRRILELFHFSLRAHGVLVLGESETASPLEEGFGACAAPRLRIFARQGSHRLSHPARLRMRTPERVTHARASAADAAAHHLLKTQVPATAIVDEQGEVEHIFGQPTPFLVLGTGSLTRRLDRLTVAPLRAVVSGVLAKVYQDREPVTYPGTTVEGVDGWVDVRAEPVPDTSSFMVSFVVRPSDLSSAAGDRTDLDGMHEALTLSEAKLQATVEELQASNEELQASNEEMLAANEELQATNEELHATNEELHTVSVERQERIQELTELQEDVDNVHRGAQIATIFIDETLRIRKLSGPVDHFIPVVDTDAGRPFTDIAHGLHQLDLDAAVQHTLDTGEPATLKGQTSRGRHVMVRVLPYDTLQPERRGIVLTLIDITSVRRTEELFRDVLNSLPQQVAVVDREGVIRLVNDAWRHGGDGTDFVGASYLAATRADPTARDIAESLEAVLAGRSSSFSTDYPCATPEGPRRFHMEVTPLQTGLDGHGGAVVSHSDITAEALLQRHVSAAERRFERLFRGHSDPIVLVAPQSMRILEANAAAAVHFGRPQNTLVGSSLLLLAPQSRLSGWRSAVASGREMTRVLEIIVGDGEERSTAVSFTPVEHQQAAAVLVQMRDTAVRARTTDETARQQMGRLEALGNLAGGVAHEMNNILAAVIAIAEEWSAYANDVPEGLHDDLREVLAACQRGRDVTHNLLGFARADQVQGRLRLDGIVEEIVRNTRRVAPSNVEVVMALEGRGPWELIGDRSQVAQALSNLALNSLHSMRNEGGELRIELRRDNSDGQQEIVVTVGDQGKGMSDAVRARAFDPFFTTKGSEGTGLGLPMVYGLVRSMNGYIEVESHLGAGTIVTLRLPVVSFVAAPATHVPQEVELAPFSALVVDDDVLVRRGTARTLRRLGATVDEASGGGEGLDKLGDHDVIILDVLMPDMSGFEVLAAIRENHPSLPVLLCSGYAERRGDEDELDPYTRFAHKPLRSDELLDELHQLLGETRSDREMTETLGG